MVSDVPCEDCLEKCSKLCWKCWLTVKLHENTEKPNKSNLEFVTSQYRQLSGSHFMSLEPGPLGLTKLKISHQPALEHSFLPGYEPSDTSSEVFSPLGDWNDGYFEQWRRRDYQEQSRRGSLVRPRTLAHTTLQQSSPKFPLLQYNVGLYEHWFDKSHQEYHEKSYKEQVKRHGMGWYVEPWEYRMRYLLNIDFPCVIRLTSPNVDHDAPRYMTEVWFCFAGKRYFTFYGMQPCGILTLPYGARAIAWKRQICIESPSLYIWSLHMWSILSDFVAWAYRRCMAVAQRAPSLIQGLEEVD